MYSKVVQTYISDTHTHTHIYIYILYTHTLFFRFFSIISHLLQDTEYNSLCYTVSHCWLSILYVVVCNVNSNPLIYPSLLSPLVTITLGLPRWVSGKESACQVEDVGPSPELGRSTGQGNGNPLQYSWLGNLMARGAWWAIVYRVVKSQTQFSN